MLKWHTGDGKGSDRILQGANQKTIILPVQFTRFDLKKRINIYFIANQTLTGKANTNKQNNNKTLIYIRSYT